MYPDKIVIETVDRIKDLYSVVSSDVSVLDPDVESGLLGRTLRYHLEKSRDGISQKTNIDRRYDDFLKAAGLKNIKEQYRNALHLIIHEKDDKISLGPTSNGGPTGQNRGFRNTKDQPLIVDTNATDMELGDSVRLGWSKCM